MLLSTLGVIEVLIRSGNVETNPGPMTNEQAEPFTEMLQLLNTLNSRSIRFEEGQSNLLESVNKIQQNHESLEGNILDLGA